MGQSYYSGLIMLLVPWAIGTLLLIKGCLLSMNDGKDSEQQGVKFDDKEE